LRIKFEQEITFNFFNKHRFPKLINVAKKIFVDRVIFFDENKLLFEQNNEKIIRSFVRLIVVDIVKVMTYDNIIKTQRKRNIKEIIALDARRRNYKAHNSKFNERKKLFTQELKYDKREIIAFKLKKYCFILQF